METAEIIHNHFKPKTPLQTDRDLRERGCGNFHFKPTRDSIPIILKQELENPTQGVAGGESLQQLETRIRRVLEKTNAENMDKIMVLVSHADPLQVFWAICNGVSPKERYSSNLRYFDNCEVREFKFE